jgi:hypothetical protein
MALNQARTVLTPDNFAELFHLQIPSGVAGVKVTLKIMRAIVREYKMSQLVRGTAQDLCFGLPDKDWYGEIGECFYFVRDEIRYIQDIDGVETLFTPDQLLIQKSGDCDDKTMLICAMLLSIGHPCRLKAVGFEPFDLSHVYAETKHSDSDHWIPLDPTENVDPGVLSWPTYAVQNHFIENL